MTADATSAVCNLGILDPLSPQHPPGSLTDTWNAFCISTESLVNNSSDPSNLLSQVDTLRNHGLQSLLQHHFLTTIQVFPILLWSIYYFTLWCESCLIFYVMWNLAIVWEECGFQVLAPFSCLHKCCRYRPGTCSTMLSHWFIYHGEM